MLDDLKNLFARSWATFLDEASRREPEDEVAGLLASMRREMVQARADLPLYEKNVHAATAEVERERRALDDAVRRGGMASRIGDAETVRVAEEFAARHRMRVAVLEEKARAAQAELELRRHESGEMMKSYKEAEANRFILVSELRRRGVQSRLDPVPPRPDVEDQLAELKRRMGKG
jgi:hypothetical protein